MKRFALALISIFAFLSYAGAQNDDVVYFYGVDFSEVKVIAAAESEQDFAKAFSAINLLLLNEAEKYDFSRVLNKNVEVYPDQMVEKSLSNDYSAMKVYRYEEQTIDIADKIKSYKLPHESGTGFVIIARYLDKNTGTAAHHVVLFDIFTREIISQNKLVSEAGGFGLRNYWARTVYNLALRWSLF